MYEMGLKGQTKRCWYIFNVKETTKQAQAILAS